MPSWGAALCCRAIRLVELRRWFRGIHRDVLRELAQREKTSVDAVLARELEDVACAHAEELASALPGLAEATGWPECCGACGWALSVGPISGDVPGEHAGGMS